MGPGQKFLMRVGSGQPFMVWVWIWKISPKNVKFFNFFALRVKKKHCWVRSESTRGGGGLASYLLRVKSKLGSGQGPYLLCDVFDYSQDDYSKCKKLQQLKYRKQLKRIS